MKERKAMNNNELKKLVLATLEEYDNNGSLYEPPEKGSVLRVLQDTLSTYCSFIRGAAPEHAWLEINEQSVKVNWPAPNDRISAVMEIIEKHRVHALRDALGLFERLGDDLEWWARTLWMCSMLGTNWRDEL